MDKPKLSQMCETFTRIGLPNQVTNKMLFDIMRFKIYPLVTDLRKKEVINWFQFLLHDKDHGVPTTPDDNNFYFHVRVSLVDNIKYDDFKTMLPEYCILTQPCDLNSVKHIGITNDKTFDTSLLKSEGIEDVWLFLGEQSEWLLNMLHAYKENIDVPLLQIHPFLHYYCNMTQLKVACPCCKNIIPCAKFIMVI